MKLMVDFHAKVNKAIYCTFKSINYNFYGGDLLALILHSEYGKINWVHFAHRPYYNVTLNSNFAILKTWNCFQLE